MSSFEDLKKDTNYQNLIKQLPEEEQKNLTVEVENLLKNFDNSLGMFLEELKKLSGG